MDPEVQSLNYASVYGNFTSFPVDTTDSLPNGMPNDLLTEFWLDSTDSEKMDRENCLDYISRYVAKRVEQTLSCGDCLAASKSSSTDPVQEAASYLVEREREGMIYTFG